MARKQKPRLGRIPWEDDLGCKPWMDAEHWQRPTHCPKPVDRHPWLIRAGVGGAVVSWSGADVLDDVWDRPVAPRDSYLGVAAGLALAAKAAKA
jgi:hypothetical protein